MKSYMMIFRAPEPDESQMPSAEQMQMVVGQWRSWIQDIAADGKYGGSHRLLSEGKTLKPGKIVTDGPYMEAKEMVGGYVIAKANSLEEAVAIAESCPNLLYGGTVEVRLVMDAEYDVNAEDFLAEKAMA